MPEFFSTRQVAKILGLRPGVLGGAVWGGRFDPPAKSPDGSFLWTLADIERACWAMLHRPLEAVDRELAQRAAREGSRQ